MPIKEYIKGSILDAPQKHIVHGVNCQNAMGSGVARVLFEKWPQVKQEYHKFCDEMNPILINGQEDLLGTINFVPISKDREVLNAFTQEYCGYDGDLYLSYKAVKTIFKVLEAFPDIKEVAIPKIGCGLAGGHWEAVEQIINLCTPNLDVYVYYLED